MLAACNLDGIEGESDLIDDFDSSDDDSASEKASAKDYFESLEKLYQRLPEKPEIEGDRLPGLNGRLSERMFAVADEPFLAIVRRLAAALLERR